MIYNSIKKLIQYGLETGLILEDDSVYATNRILEVLQEEEYEEPQETYSNVDLEETLKELLDYAAKKGVLEHDSIVYRDLFDTKLMGCLVPRPSEVTARFNDFYQKSPREATDYFYKLSQDTDYIRRYRIKKDIRWKAASKYGDIDISINLSKPEKD